MLTKISGPGKRGPRKKVVKLLTVEQILSGEEVCEIGKDTYRKIEGEAEGIWLVTPETGDSKE